MPYSRILITGGPRTGKTTLAEKIGKHLGVEVTHTDAFMHIAPDWGGQSLEAAQYMYRPAPWVMEGTTVARGLRKWLAGQPPYQHDQPVSTPCDLLLLGDQVYGDLSKGQETMAKGVHTVLKGVVNGLIGRGVAVMSFTDFLLSHPDLGGENRC